MGDAEAQAISTVLKYRAPARALHWTVAVLVLVVWPLGAVIEFVREDVKLTFYMIHESLGFIILWLMLARLAFRLLNPPPPPVPMSPAERRIADWVHASLYALLILQPVTGFLATNAHGFPLTWFWLVPIPSPIDEAPAIAPVFSVLHVIFAWAILILFVLHIGGVLRHQILRRDETLERMI